MDRARVRLSLTGLIAAATLSGITIGLSSPSIAQVPGVQFGGAINC